VANEQEVLSRHKTCSKCEEVKPLHKFSRHAQSSDGRRPDCKECQARRNAVWYLKDQPQRQAARASYYERNREHVLARQKQYAAANPDKIAKNARRNRLKAYGLSLEEYDQLFLEQGGVCLICKRPETITRNLPVDHDHTTGKVRGLLCTPCNSVLGLVDEDSERLRLMAEYLERTL
jgi:Autographiviridae endonuclease VII